MFENARPKGYLSLGFLRPYKKKLPDIFVTGDLLPRALEEANALYLHLESRAYRVSLAPPRQFRRNIPDPDQRRAELYWDHWAPHSPTIVEVRAVVFGLRIFETTKSVETVWVNDKKVSVDSLPPRSRERYGHRSTSTLPTGLLSVIAYSPYVNTSWQREWRETVPGALQTFLNSITRELESAAPMVTGLVVEAEKRAELERQRWEEQERTWRRQETERRRTQANKESREQLLAAIEEWALAKRVVAFLQDASDSVARLQGGMRDAAMARLERARLLLGETDALAGLRSWKSPEEICHPLADESS
jgi:hypothetical protein